VSGNRHDIGFMLSSSRKIIHGTVTKKLTQINASVDVMNAVPDILSTPLPYEVACDTLQSGHDLNGYIQNKFGYVKPVQYCLCDAGDVSQIKKSDFVQYIPILETLKVLQQNDDIFSSVLSDHQSSEGHVSSTGGKEVMVQSLHAFIRTAIVPAVGYKDIMFRVSSVDVDGVRFSPNMAVVCGVSNDSLCFSRIETVFISDGMPVFICRKLEQQQFWRHCHAYSFAKSQSTHVLRVADLVDPFPLPRYTDINNQLCVVLKHTLATAH